jgi:putative phage-type endonuclease
VSDIVPQSPEWHALRRTGIGGSDAAAVLGISPWTTPYRVWAEKVGEPIEPIEVTEEMRWGSLLEPLILHRYMETTQRLMSHPGFVRHPKFAWLIGNIDAASAGEDYRIVEAKTARTWQGWGEPSTDEIPEHYLCQVHHYLIVTGAPLADVAVLIGGSDFRIYTVEPDPAIHADLIEREAAFWDRVQKREPPDPISADDAQRRWGRVSRIGQVSADQETIEAVERARALQKAIKNYGEALDSGKLAIMSALADRGDTLVDSDGNVLATWKIDNGTKGYTVAPREPRRRLLIKERKE